MSVMQGDIYGFIGENGAGKSTMIKTITGAITPDEGKVIYEGKEYTELNRCVTRREYEKVLDYAFELGIENGFFQDGETARESFIPAFDYEGVRKMP